MAYMAKGGGTGSTSVWASSHSCDTKNSGVRYQACSEGSSIGLIYPILLMTCSPETDPATMRVRRPEMGKRRRTLDEEETHPRADRAQAARGGGRAGSRGLKPRGRKEAWHQRGYLPPLEEPVRWDESRCDEAPEGAGVREHPLKEDRGRPSRGHQHPQGGEPGKLLSPSRRKAAAEHVRRRLGVSERRACGVIGQ